MRPGTREWLKMRLVLTQLSKLILLIGAVLWFNDVAFSKWIVVAGAFLFGINLILKGFDPIHEEPDWEMVFPELALSHDENFDVHAYVEEKLENEKSKIEKL